MPKARKRKDTQFNNKMSKCVFLYGEPTNDKVVKIRKMQAEFVKLINNYIKALNDNSKVTLQLIKADNKDSQMRAFEKSIRPEKVNAAYCQNAFDIAVTHLSNRLDNIRLICAGNAKVSLPHQKYCLQCQLMEKPRRK